MSGNSANVREKLGENPQSRNGHSICVVGEIRLWQLNKMTYLYFIRTVIHFFHMWCSRRICIMHILNAISSGIVREKSGIFLSRMMMIIIKLPADMDFSSVVNLNALLLRWTFQITSNVFSSNFSFAYKQLCFCYHVFMLLMYTTSHSASEMTCIVSSGALNSTHSLVALM